MTKILIIYTGGTIGMMTDPKTKALVPINFEQIMDNVPELERLNCQIEVRSFDKIIDSSNMNPEIWSELATIIENYYDRVDGFVILHGSDTMAFTSSALSFMLENLAKPVIFTDKRHSYGCKGKSDDSDRDYLIDEGRPRAGTRSRYLF
jgi:L-asparaginase